jgi:CRISPR-associated protein Csm1
VKYLSNHILILKQLLHQLGLRPFEGNTEGVQQNKAAQWALNDPTFKLQHYEITTLRPVLETLNRGTSKHFVNPKQLSTDLAMPMESIPNNLQEHFKDFKLALSEAKDEQLLTILEIWASSIAVSEKYNDLSLFDFIRTTVGITACFEQGNGRLRLLGGTISGIQSYLYEIISKNAAKLLKGRSFYIQLLTDSLLDEVLHEFDLSVCHVVYSSGGGFYVLVPDTEGVEKTFEDFRNSISKQIYKEHKTALFAELAMTAPFDLSAKVDTIWDELFTELGKLKYKRLHNNADFVNDFFDFIEVGGTKSDDRDPITNEEFRDTDKRESLYKEANAQDSIIVKQMTKDQIELGKDLRNADYWLKSKQPFLSNERRTLKDPFGTCHYLLSETEFKKLEKTLKQTQITVLNKTDKSLPFVFYGGNQFPTDPATGYAKGFDELIENDNFKRLAIVRMDVDGLGAIFSGDIATDKYNLNWVRYVSVSRSLDQFFKGYLNTLQNPYKDNSVIIYSGGDDLFIVGKWDSIITLSETIHTEFNNWSCNNLTLSGGIVLLPNKFPVMQGARLAEDVEKKAKSHEFGVDTEGGEKAPYKKNAITLFDVPLNWDTEFAIVKDLYSRLRPFILPKDRKIDKSYVSKIYAHAERQQLYEKTQKELADAKKEGRQPKPHLKEFSPAWRWTMAYDMARFKERVKDPDAKQFIEEMATACFVNRYDNKPLISKYSFLTLLQLAARWVEFEYRSKNNED